VGEGGGVGEVLGGDQGFQGGEPVVIVGVAVVGVAGGLGALDLGGEGGGPLAPGEEAAFVQGQHEREGLRLPGLAENGSLGVAGQAGQVGGGHRSRVARRAGHQVGSR
jgi:hypothetical protein